MFWYVIMVKKRQRSLTSAQDSYVLIQPTMNEMLEQIKKTHETGKEHGMSLCSRNHQILIGQKSIGTDTGISLSEKCANKKDKYIGSFHTHPTDSEAAPSAQDLFSSCLRISNLDCIGKNSKGEIVCYDKKEKGSSCIRDAKPLKDIEDIFYDVPVGDLDSVKREVYSHVDKVAKKHFDLIKVK